MKSRPGFLPLLAVAMLAAFAYAKYNAPERKLERAKAQLQQMERAARRDDTKLRRAEEDVNRMRFMPLHRFPKGTSQTGKKRHEEKARDTLDDVKDWYDDKREALKAQREEVERLEELVKEKTRARKPPTD